MPQYAIDVVVSPSAPVVDVTAVGVQGPPGVPGPPGPAGEPGPAGPAGTGNVTGPASATDNSLALFDGATGKLLDAGPDGRISGSVSIGTAPAQSGAVRLGHDQAIMMRNGANTADLRLAASYGDTLYLGQGAALIVTQPPIQSHNNGTLTDVGSVAIGTNPAQSGAVRLANGGELRWRNGGNNADVVAFSVDNSNNLVVGQYHANPLYLDGSAVNIRAAAVLESSVTIGTTVQLTEMAAPGVAAANQAFLYLKDNGSGKTQLMVQFATGAAIQIAIQP